MNNNEHRIRLDNNAKRSDVHIGEVDIKPFANPLAIGLFIAVGLVFLLLTSKY
jgi:hypothetical protein